MRIALCSVQVPFERGGNEYLCDNLYDEMKKRGYEVEHIKIPFKWYPPEEIINSSIVWKLLDLIESNGKKIDGVIATKFPSYLVNHQNKVVWLVHQHRSAYDKAYTEFDDLTPYGKVGELIRNKIQAIDNKNLPETKKIYTIAQNVTSRLWKYNNIKGTTLYPPPPFLGKYHCNGYGDYVFYPSRLDSLKRQDLIIKCMKFIKSNLRLKISGTGPQLEYYKKIAKEYNVSDKVDFLGYVSEDQLIELYANAFCVAYTPYDEDLGFVTMESFFSKKPVITCIDSGGSLEFVEDSINGYVVDPLPEMIAEKIDFLYKYGNCKEMGENAYKKIKHMDLSWDNVIEKLVGSIK